MFPLLHFYVKMYIYLWDLYLFIKPLMSCIYLLWQHSLSFFLLLSFGICKFSYPLPCLTCNFNVLKGARGPCQFATLSNISLNVDIFLSLGVFFSSSGIPVISRLDFLHLLFIAVVFQHFVYCLAHLVLHVYICPLPPYFSFHDINHMACKY